MTEPGITDRSTAGDGLPGANDEPSVPSEAAAVLAAAGVSALTAKLVNRWTLAGTATLVVLGAAALLLRSRSGPLTTGS